MRNVKRVTLTGDWTAIQFDDKVKNYFVKNFSSNAIYVSFEANDTEDTSFKISAGIGERVAINQSNLEMVGYKTDTIYVKGTGEVEIQQM